MSIFLVSLLIFGGMTPFSLSHYPLSFLLISPIIWTAFRLNQSGVGLSIFIISGMAILGTVHGFGPFARASLNISLLTSQAFVSIVALTGLVVTIVITEQKTIEEVLRLSEEKFRGIFNSSKDAIGYVDMRGILLDVNKAFVRLTGSLS